MCVRPFVNVFAFGFTIVAAAYIEGFVEQTIYSKLITTILYGFTTIP